MSVANDTIEMAKKRARQCALNGLNIHANPYRNLPASVRYSDLQSAFDAEFKTVLSQKNPH